MASFLFRRACPTVGRPVASGGQSQSGAGKGKAAPRDPAERMSIPVILPWKRACRLKIRQIRQRCGSAGAGVGNEQLFALAGQAADPFLAVRRQKPVGKTHGAFMVRLRAVTGVEGDDPVLVEQARVALEQDPVPELVGEGQPGGAVGQGMAAGLHGKIERRAHAASRFQIPAPGKRFRVGADGAPEILFLLVGAAFVAARGEAGAGTLDAAHGLPRIGGVTEAGRIALRADDDEVIVHQVVPRRAVACVNERLLGGARMHDQHVAVAVLRVLQGLPGADGNNLDGDPGLGGEGGKDMAVEAGILGRGGRLDDDGLGGACRRLHGEQGHRGENGGENACHAGC